MTNSKATKRTLLGSVITLLLCCAMLLGTTFAWFTDSVTTGKNTITAGNLKISAFYQDTVKGTEEGTEYTIDGLSRNKGKVKFSNEKTDINENNAIITENLWEPGAVGAKLITVNNIGNLAAKVKLVFSVEDGGLQDALWFDLVQVGSDGSITGTFTKRDMNTLTTFGSNVEIPLMPQGTDGDSISFILFYGMKEEAGNIYQGKSFEASVVIVATQYTYEKDSFDETYDADAIYPIANGDDLKSALSEGGTVEVGADIDAVNENTYNGRNSITKDTVLNLGDSTIRFRNAVPDETGAEYLNISALYVSGGTVTINSTDGGIDSDFYGIVVGFENAPGELIINGGVYKAGSVVQVQYGTVTINGGLFDGREIYGEGNEASYLLNCLDQQYKDKKANIIVTGGTFVNFNPAGNNAEGVGTNFVAEGYTVVSEEKGDNLFYTVVPIAD